MQEETGGEERMWRWLPHLGKVPPRTLCLQGLKIPFVSSESIRKPGDRPTPFLEACRLTPARYQCKHLQYAHRRAAAACPKQAERCQFHVKKKKGPLAFLFGNAGHRTGSVRLSESIGLGTRLRRLLLPLPPPPPRLLDNAGTEQMCASSCSRDVRKVWPTHSVS